jgi:hypothetical protein
LYDLPWIVPCLVPKASTLTLLSALQKAVTAADWVGYAAPIVAAAV